MTDNNWRFVDDELPTKSGYYLVVWSEPFQDEPSISVKWFWKGTSGGFVDNPSGANEILFWQPLPNLPELEREGLRTRLTIKQYGG